MCMHTACADMLSDLIQRDMKVCLESQYRFEHQYCNLCRYCSMTGVTTSVTTGVPDFKVCHENVQYM